ncbi:Bis(5'-nucleosyl)-tetraphosphatase [asymmetrical] domain protein [Teladorsagia circumcincta]|uniref:Bis(5'-nucleosyl)-tetraphosphatase [asymmetrical] domain protein n=1 Tax=Teladorsagia circumcincta TaxID=45464 RepID=A0A2G9TAR7_TELCI|nr:Bis(5'-nucleosyl)-tetraphosphatase [asymmetrical] domain protein [Teladorsagia circumcincta]
MPRTSFLAQSRTVSLEGGAKLVKGKPKTVKYWLALLKNPDDVKLSHEHQMWKWAELDEAIKIAEYAEMGALLRKFKAYVDNLKS